MATLYDQPGYLYDQPVLYDDKGYPTIGIGCTIQNRSTKTLQIQARCSAKSSRIVTIKADISKREAQTFTCQARIAHKQTIQCQAHIIQPRQIKIQAAIRNSSLRQLSIKVWFSRQQGYPVIDPSSPAYPLFQPTQLILKASIVNNVTRNAQSVTINASISPRRSKSFTSQARIGRSGRISIQANIVPKLFTTTVLGTFDVQGTLNTVIFVTFNVEGLYTAQALGIGTRIVRSITRRVVGHFIVPATPISGHYDASFIGTGDASSRAIVGIGAFIS